MPYSGQIFASPQEALQHHGVKGMHWGVRNANGPSRSELRGMNKVARAENKVTRKAAQAKANASHDASVMKARANVASANAQWKTAKTQYKTEKMQIGKVAAKRALNSAKDTRYKTLNKANELTVQEQKRRDRVGIGVAILSGVLQGVA